MYQRTRYRDPRALRDPRDLRDHCDLSSELSDETSSLYTGSTASTRERLLQGRWRQSSLDGSQDSSSISTLRYSEPDTCRSFSSTSSMLSPARRYPRFRPHNNINRTRSFQSVRPTSPVRQEDLTFQEYKSLSAQDFRKGILREERLALDTDDDRLSSTLDSQDLDRGSLRSARFSPTASISSFSSFNYNPPPLDEIFPMRHLTMLDSTNKEKLSKEVDDELTTLLRNSQSENTRLKVELKALESLLESAKFQLKSTKEKVSEDNVEYEKDKQEDDEINKKVAEMEEELKLLSYSENLTDQAMGQLKADNERLRGERGDLLQVLYKLSRIN